MKKISLLFILIISTIPLYSQEISQDDYIIAERPGVTNPPAVISKGMFQIESGFFYESDKIKDSNIKNEYFLYPTNFFRFGVMKNFELRLQIDIAGLKTTSSLHNNDVSLSGLNPIIISEKIYLCKQKKFIPESAFVFGLTLPYTGKKEFQHQYLAPGFAFYFQNTINDKWNVGYNLGMQWNGNDANPISYVSLAPGYNITQKIAVSAEVYSFFTKNNIPDFRFDGGIGYILIQNLQLDFSLGSGISGPTSNFALGFGISLRLPH